MRVGASAWAMMMLVGCKEILPDVEITGKLDIDGDVPGGYTFELYSALSNTDAFDPSFCEDLETESTCYGRVLMNQLGEPEPMDEPVVDGTDFTLTGVAADVGYILVVGGDDPGVPCSTDIIGVDGPSKVVTEDSAITIKLDGSLKTFELPRPASLSCAAPPDEPGVPDEEDPQPPPDGEDIPPPANPAWEVFQITGKGGSPMYGDASAASVAADVACDASFPSVFQVHGEIDGATAAFIRIQFGSGDEAEYQTIATSIEGGVVDQEITLTGGYAVVQLDTDETLDGNGESNTITFCERDDRPVQEFTLILSWDKDDTDVDSHVFAAGEEVAYYSLQTSWGELDIDDIDGFGPETLTSKPSVSGETYDVRIHYYSDHGNGATNATARVIYADPEGGVCDVSASRDLSDGDWWSVGTFAPGLCP